MVMCIIVIVTGKIMPLKKLILSELTFGDMVKMKGVFYLPEAQD